VSVRGWSQRFFGPQPQHGMVIARIGLGAIAVLSGLSKLPDVPRLFGRAGIAGAAWSAGGEGIVDLRTLLRLPLEQGPPGSEWLLFAAMLVAALAFTLGAWTRPAGWTLLLLHACFYQRNEFAYVGSWATMYLPFLLYTLLAPSGRWCSVDAWRHARRGRPPPPDWLGPAIPVRLLQTNVCTLYAVAGWARLVDPGWLGGEMV